MTASRSLSLVLWVGFALLVATIMFVLLRACGLVLPGYGIWHHVGMAYCSRPTRTATVGDAGRLTDEARRLQMQLLQAKAECLEQRVAPPSSAPLTVPRQATIPATPPAAAPTSPAPQVTKPPVRPEPSPQLSLPSAPTRDMSFIAGCWRTDPFRHSPEVDPGVSTYCFDAQGRGSLEFVRPSHRNYVCRTNAQAGFEGETLRIHDSDTRCSDGSSWYADKLDCRRGAGSVAECSGSSSTPNGPHRWTVRLNRMQ